MPAFDVALVELGKLLGFFKDNGEVNWQWFGRPIKIAFSTLPSRRNQIGAIIRALLDRPTDPTNPTNEFTADSNWEPILDTSKVDIGFTWSKDSDLQLGIGAKVNIPGDSQQIDLAVLARLIRIVEENVTPELGQAKLTGTFPVPNFLSRGELNIDITKGPTLAVGLKATDKQQPQFRQLDFPNPVIAWDAARLAVFVLKAWIKQRAEANPNDSFFNRVNNHLFPMMGDPTGVIKAFPLVAPMKALPDFDAWRGSVLTTNDNATGALTFLWHLRALLTGIKDPSFLQGSFFFPLSGDIQVGNPPTLADSNGRYVRPMGTTGAWVGILTNEPAGTFTLVLDLETAAPKPAANCRIPLVRFDGENFERPSLDESWKSIVEAIAADTRGFPISTEVLRAVSSGAGFRLSLFRTKVAGSGFAGFDGPYDVAIHLENNKAPEFTLGTPALDITFPPEINNPGKLLGDVVVWALRAAAPDDNHGKLIVAAGEFVRKAATNTVRNLDEVDLLTKVVGVAGQDPKIRIELSPDASLNLEIEHGKVNTGIEFGPIENPSIPIYVGKLKGTLVINPAAEPVLDGFTLGFKNLRLSNDSAGSGIVASLIPDMRQFPGFHLTVDYTSGKLRITGGGKIPIQRTIGPLEIAALLVDIREKSFAVGLDLTFQLSVITITAYELGIRYDFENVKPTPFLHGLALSMDTGFVKLAGFFGAVDTDGVTDYVGGATVSVAGYFELSAMGGYTQLPDNSASLFIFASLVAPLGGPPWFFITGVAGGFGYNRALPAPGLLLEHPFLKVMRGEIAIGKNAGQALRSLSVHFAAMKGQFWIAAGIQFTAFGFINGKVVVAIAFGNRFSITVLGMASFAIRPICSIEIGIEATADEEKFLLRARLSPNSYVIHPDIFKLQGDLALGAWYDGPHKGDFLFSIGGYHPLFAKPNHYPELMRVGCKAIVYNFVHLSVEVFFACTPQALMAGAQLSLWGEFSRVSAGIDLYVDVLMKWDPFFLKAKLSVKIWFEFWGRHEVGVDIEIWTPNFGGKASIDVAVCKFEVEFGESLPKLSSPSIAAFMSKQLGVPAKQYGAGPAQGARTAAFSTDAGAGLFRIEFLKGRPGKEQSPKDDKQEGLDPNNPVHLNPEWSFLVRTRLPLGKVDTKNTVEFPVTGEVTGEIDLPLCNTPDLASTLKITEDKIGNAKRIWLTDFFPAANFGEQLPEPKDEAHARDSITTLKTDAPSIAMVEGAIIDYEPELKDPPQSLTAPSGEPSEAKYPVPLGPAQSGPSHGLIKEAYTFSSAAKLPITFPADINRREAALADLGAHRQAPFTVFVRDAEVQRFTKLSATRTYTVTPPTADIFVVPPVPVMAPPQSPSRPSEMFGVQLRALPVRANEPVQRRQMETLRRAKSLKQSLVSPRGGVSDSFQTTLTVAAGHACQIEFGGGGIGKSRLKFNGDQTVRALIIDRGGRVLLDVYLRNQPELTIPKGSAQAVLIGEGLTPEPINTGIERESILLATGSRQFVGHGCCVSVLSNFELAVQPLDSLPGADLFDYASTLRVLFPNPTHQEGTFVLKLVPTVERPAPAVEQVRWLAAGAQLQSLIPVVSPARVALVMGVHAPAAWSVDIDLGPEWKLDGIILVSRIARLVADDLQRNPDWDLIDDAMPVHPHDLSSTVTLEARS